MPMNVCQPGLFEALPPNQITTIQRNGNSYYVYADQSSHQVLMGQSSALKNYNSLVSRQLPAVASASRQAEKKFVMNGVTPQQRRSMTGVGRQVQRYWNNNIIAKRKHRSAPVASNSNLAANPVITSEPSAPMAKELPSSGGIERQARREWKKIGI